MSTRFRVIIVVLLIAIIALLVFLVIKLTGSDNNTVILPTTTTTTSTSTAPAPPQSPSNLTGVASSTTAVTLTWVDNSSDEYGFIIYRDSVELTRLDPGFTNFTNLGLKPSTTYQYSVKAYNKTGESGAVSCTVKTLNPPLTIRLDKIGVFDNREDITRGESGEVYVFVVVNDGRTTPVNMRFPQVEKRYYKLAKNETIDINTILFSAPNVGDSLTLTIFGFENDGEGFEAIAYKALENAIELQAAGIAGALLETFDIKLSEVIGQLMGEADDRLGSYEKTWDISNNWGSGQYKDIVCKDENGVDCLRLWFTISGE
jgi:hypothetical protein